MRLMQAASRQSLAEATDRLNGRLDQVTENEAERLGEELFAAVDLLLTEVRLRRHLADPSTSEANKRQLLRAVLGEALSQPTVEVLGELVGSRWSQPRDLADAAETLGQLAMLSVAQKQGVIEEVEDELFRIGRLVDREPQLRTMLADVASPPERRVELLRSVVSGKAHPVTERLLVRAVQAPHGLSLDRAAEELAELAAACRERSIARVSTPLALTDDQQQRLSEALSRIYRRPISLQVELRPELIGGLVVRVADEVIDGSIAGRLVAAKRRLPH
jgi:F-type H+-transporting ATPase subunit delta